WLPSRPCARSASVTGVGDEEPGGRGEPQVQSRTTPDAGAHAEREESGLNPAIFAGVLVALLASSAGGKQPNRAPISTGSVVAVLIWSILGPALVFEIGTVIDAVIRGEYRTALIALGFAIATAIVLFPWPIVRTLLIPRGRVK